MKNSANRNPVLSRLGLAMRAGKVVSGDEGVLSAIRSRSARLVLLAEDASENAAKKYSDKCRFYGIPLVRRFTRRELGASIGKADRVVVAVTDEGLAELIMGGLTENGGGGTY